MKQFFKKKYDNFLIKREKRKELLFKKSEKERHNNIIDFREGNDIISKYILESKPGLFCKIGSTELNLLSIYHGTDKIKDWSSMKKDPGRFKGGIYPDTADIFSDFCKIYTECLGEIDAVGLWYLKNEFEIVETFCKKTVKVNSMCFLEPYFFETPWSRALKGKRVLVVSPFQNSIKSQFYRKDEVWLNSVLPDFELKTMTVPQNAGIITPKHENWVIALNSLKEQINTYNFDVVILGCGAWSVPLALYCKRLGKVAIHTGGATQILFGIKGTRWDENPSFQNFYNKSWINVLDSDLTNVDSEKINLIPKHDQYW